MQVIETFLCGKENNFKTCEDGIFIGENLAAVVDGVTAKGTKLWDGRKSGCYAKDKIIEYLNLTSPEQSAKELFCNLDAVLHDSIAPCKEELLVEDYPRASVIVYNHYYKEIWSYGDCQCRLNDKVYSHVKKIDRLNADLRAYVLEYELLNGKTLEMLKANDLGRNAIQKNLQMQFQFENCTGEFGYPVLNGQGIREEFIKIYPVEQADEIILASDGYPVVGKNLSESEKELERILKEDPMCFRQFPSTKGVQRGNISFDDRAFCRIKIKSSKKVPNMLQFY